MPGLEPSRADATIIEVERDHYRNALEEARKAVWALRQAALFGPVPRLVEKLEALSIKIDQARRFRRFPCPKCGGPSDFSNVFVDPGPSFGIYSCGNCGIVRTGLFGKPEADDSKDQS